MVLTWSAHGRACGATGDAVLPAAKPGASRRAAPPRAVLLGALLLLLGLLGLRGPAAWVQPPPTQDAVGRRSVLLGSGALLGALPAMGGLLASPGAARAQLTPQELHQVELFSRSSPGVVGITEGHSFKGLPRGAKSGASGSAFVWDAEHVVTNFHVIADMVAPRATFLLKGASGEEIRSTHDLQMVGGDPLSDIAVLRAPSLRGAEVQRLIQPLGRGTSLDLVPGQQVFALGNPYGLEHSMSLGVISGVSRTMPMGMGSRPMGGIIQTDAAINPGNSGGPLLDSEGNVVGMNAAIMSSSGSFSGVGLAIPIDLVQHHVSNMLADGYVSRAALGVTFAPTGMSQALGIDGVMVMRVVPEGPASKAGVRALRKGRFGDVIVSIEGKRMSSSDDVVKVLDTMSPGRRIRMQLKRASGDLNSDSYDYVDLSVVLASSGAMNYPMIAV